MICSQCNKEFSPTHHAQKYCSKECSTISLKKYLKEYHKEYDKKYNEGHKKTTTIICPQCNKEFIKTGKNQKYCSKECYKKSDTFNKSQKKYRQSDSGKEAKKRGGKKYQESAKGKKNIKVAQKKHKQSEKGKATLKGYRQSGKDKAAKDKYQYSDRGRAIKNKYESERKKTDPIYKLIRNARSRVAKILKLKNIKKLKSTIQSFGCTPEFLKKHLEKQFHRHPDTHQPMNWKNHTIHGWHVDHRIPLDSAKTSEDVITLNHYTNLQPMWATENRKKSNKII